MTRARTAMRWIAVWVALLVAVQTDARAQEGPTAAERKRANQLIGQANRDKKKGDRYGKRAATKDRAMDAYKSAVLKYMEAYSLIEHPMLVLKLAEVYRARGEKRWALRGYRRYLAISSSDRKTAEVEKVITELEEEIAFDEANDIEPTEDDSSELEPTAVFGLAEEPRREPEPKKEPEPEKEPGATEDEDGDRAEEEEAEEEEAEEPTRRKKQRLGLYLRYGGIGTASAGVILLAVGIKYGLDARSASSDLSGNDDGWTADDRALIKSGESAENKALIFSFLGAAALVGGGVLYYYGEQSERKARARPLVWAPRLTPTSALMSVSGRF